MNTQSIIKTTFASLLLFSFLFIGCSQDCTEGSGNIATETINLSDIRGINLDLSSNVIFHYSETQEIQITGDDNIIDNVSTTVTDNIWHIDLKKGCYKNFDLEIVILTPSLDHISIDGSGDVTVNDFSDQDNLELFIDGSGDIVLNKQNSLDNLSIEIDGSGSVKANKIINVPNLDIQIDGSGNINGFDIISDNCDVNISGSGDCEVTVNDDLDVRIDGSGNAFYRGNPNITQSISGSGELINAN